MSIEKAITLHRAGRFAEAERTYRTILADNPKDSDALHFYGVLRGQGGDFAGAADLIGRSLTIDPGAPQAHFHIAGVLARLGKMDEALAHYTRSLALQPSFLQAQLARISLLLELGRIPEALDLCRCTAAPGNPQLADLHGSALLATNANTEALNAFETAIRFKSEFVEAHYHRAQALHALGRNDEALKALAAAILLRPDFAEAHFSRGNILSAMKRPGEALTAFERVIALKPDFSEAHGAMAGVLFEQKRWQDSLAASTRALSLKPGMPNALLDKGRALVELKLTEEALAAFDRAVALTPNDAKGHLGRGGALAKLGRSDEALAAFDRAIALDPAAADAHSNRANTMIELERPDEALEAFHRAIALQPESAIFHFNLGTALLDLERYDEALAEFDATTALKPNFAESYYNRSATLYRMGRKEQSTVEFEKALAIDPDLGLVVAQRFFEKAMRCDWSGRGIEIADLKRLCTEGRLVDPLAVIVAFDDPTLHLAAARSFAGPTRSPQISHAPAKPGRLRVAYLSPDFSNHPVALQIVDLLERHDRSRFEVFGICEQSAADTDIRGRIKQAFDHFDEAQDLSDIGIAKLVAEREIDIAIDLGGHTGEARLKALSYRPAPVQVSYLGFPGSTGADYIDYLIADHVTVPEGAERFYSESIVRLPHCFFPTDTTSGPDVPTPTREEAGLPEGFVFCSFNNNYKITPGLYDIWMRLLHAVDDSVLWLRVESPAARANLRLEAERRGVDPYRLVFADAIDRGAHFARIGVADLFLDSIPYNAHTTANDALRCGVPVLTCTGKSFASRVAASMLETLGLPELITTNLRDYETLALNLARMPDRLAIIRQKLIKARAESPLFDMSRLCRQIETAYETMRDIHHKKQSPHDFSVTPER